MASRDTSGLIIRAATADDAASINEIQNYYVKHTTVLFQSDPTTLEERRVWMAEHSAQYPVIVAELEHEVVGWASLSPYYRRKTAWHTAEDSVYVRHDLRQLGIGRALLTKILDRARELRFHSVVAEIHDQPGSITLHQKMGFQIAGRIQEAGHKLGEWNDVILMQLMLTADRNVPPAPPECNRFK